MDQTLIRAFRLFSVSENFLVVEDTLSLYKTIPQCLITIHLTGKIKDRANSSNVYIESCSKVSIVSTRGTKRKKRRPKRKKLKRCVQVLWMVMINIVKERKQKLRQRTGWFQTKKQKILRKKLISGSVIQLVGLSMSPAQHRPQRWSIFRAIDVNGSFFNSNALPIIFGKV